MMIKKFVEDGPFTKEFTNESPAKAAVWIGSRIIEAYMKRNNLITPDSLMRDNDYQEMLRKSNYKP